MSNIADDIQAYFRDPTQPIWTHSLARGHPSIESTAFEASFKSLVAPTKRDYFSRYATPELRDYCKDKPTLRRATNLALKRLEMYLNDTNDDPRSRPGLQAALWSDPESAWTECVIHVLVDKQDRDRWYERLSDLFRVATAGTSTSKNLSIQVGLRPKDR